MLDQAPSRISPGLSFNEAALPERPAHPPLDGDARCDVCVVGGGFTGLSAAAHLAARGADVRLIEAERLGDGASARNGGQMNTGQRADVLEHEAAHGPERARALFDLAQEAKAHLHEFAAAHGIDMGYVPGHLTLAHHPRALPQLHAWAEALAARHDYPHLTPIDREETARLVGSTRFAGGVRDVGTGHLDPARLLVGTARAAVRAGARLHEGTRAVGVRPQGGRVLVGTARGTVTADRVLLAVNGHGGDLVPDYARHVMPIRSFIAATAPLPGGSGVLPGGESANDTRDVVRYFRRVTWPDGRSRLLFGGREAYHLRAPRDLVGPMRAKIAEVYPALRDHPIEHAWGGSVGVTATREPFVRELAPGLTAIGGFSGHGVMLSHLTGRLYAEAVAGNRDRLAAFEALPQRPFPGGRRARPALLALAMGWAALRDRL